MRGSSSTRSQARTTPRVEAEACGRYEEALRLGLTGDDRRRCLCQYGSTLRWLGDLQASLAVLEGAAEEFPESDSVRVFRALTLNEIGRHDEAVAGLLALNTDDTEVTDLGRYATDRARLADWCRAGRPGDAEDECPLSPLPQDRGRFRSARPVR